MFKIRKWEGSTVLLGTELFVTIHLFAGVLFYLSMFTLGIHMIVLELQQNAK